VWYSDIQAHNLYFAITNYGLVLKHAWNARENLALKYLPYLSKNF